MIPNCKYEIDSGIDAVQSSKQYLFYSVFKIECFKLLGGWTHVPTAG